MHYFVSDQDYGSPHASWSHFIQPASLIPGFAAFNLGYYDLAKEEQQCIDIKPKIRTISTSQPTKSWSVL